jgi:RNA polymerase sigma-70 factor, ECF subfamily
VGDSVIVGRLRAGDERAFAEVVDAYTPGMLRLARMYGVSRNAAEDVVQETWLRALRALDSFEERAGFRTWVYAILANCARRRAETDSRSVPLADLSSQGEREEPAVEPTRFFPAGHPRWAGMWTTHVEGWESIPDERLLAGEARQRFRAAIEELPPRYAVVFVLRDVEGWTSDELCSLLGLTPENQRVLLHRARSRIRSLLEEYFSEDTA